MSCLFWTFISKKRTDFTHKKTWERQQEIDILLLLIVYLFRKTYNLKGKKTYFMSRYITRKYTNFEICQYRNNLLPKNINKYITPFFYVLCLFRTYAIMTLHNFLFCVTLNKICSVTVPLSYVSAIHFAIMEDIMPESLFRFVLSNIHCHIAFTLPTRRAVVARWLYIAIRGHGRKVEQS